MAHTFRFLVSVDTDYANPDAPGEQKIADELQSNLEFDAPLNGITGVRVVPVCYECGAVTCPPQSDGERTLHTYCGAFRRHLDAGGSAD